MHKKTPDPFPVCFADVRPRSRVGERLVLYTRNVRRRNGVGKANRLYDGLLLFFCRLEEGSKEGGFV